MTVNSKDVATMPSAEWEGWTHAPFDAASAKRVREVLHTLDKRQLLWLSGYLAASAEHSVAQPPPVTNEASASSIIAYGSQSGNSERVAKLLAEKLAHRNIAFTLLDMIDCRKAHLQSARTLLAIVSTHGEGDPPDRALPFLELLEGRKAPRLDHLAYSVLALGDSSYEKFCETSRQLDSRVETLGGKRLQAREDCDVDFEMPARRWIDSVVDKVAVGLDPKPSVSSGEPEARTARVSTAYTPRNPFDSEVLANQRLTVRGSSKDVRHIELSLEGSHIHYEPGDAIGIVPRNRPAEVDALLELANFDPHAQISLGAQTYSLRDGLINCFEIGPVSESLLHRYASVTGAQPLSRLCGEPDEARRYLRGRHLIDLLREYRPLGLKESDFAQLLRPLAPRLYSIASSQLANPDEAHLTVSVVEYESFNTRRQGVVSGLLASTDTETTVPIYLHRNSGFRLPADPRTPIVMIGPGTGVAPFRAFVAEREAMSASGHNWLFFGDRSFESEFLYQAEWLGWRKRGVLTRIDVAFSRDQDEKVYVQHRLREGGRTLWTWMQEGAHIYLCGDAERMAPDVHAVLIEIVQCHGGLTNEKASEYLTDMQRARRYQRDVY